MDLKQLGYFGKITELIPDTNSGGFELARVVQEHKERYVVQTTSATLKAEITGNLRYSTASRADFPAVGDWVQCTVMDGDTAYIIRVLPRTSVLQRQAVDKHGEAQLIATNIDFAFIVQSVGHDYNLNRMERYIALCHSAGIQPILVLTKTDLISHDELDSLITEVENHIPNLQLITCSVHIEGTLSKLKSELKPYHTYCFLGSSGVGKSTLINALKDEASLKTQDISQSTGKGKHTTTHRELIILPNCSIVIDTPGMREVGMAEASEGIELTYDQIMQLSQQCKYRDCTHTQESGCAVLQALEDGSLSEKSYRNYLKLKSEQEHYASTAKEKRDKDKSFGKMVKEVMKEKKRNRY